MPSIKKIIRFLWKEFIYGGHLQSIGAAGVTFITVNLLKINYEWSIFLTSYLIFYTLYLYDRYKGLQTDKLTNPKRSEHFQRYYRFRSILLILVVIAAISSLAYFSNVKALIFGSALIIFGLLYFSIFKKITKKVTSFKNIYVASFFALLVFLPFFYYSLPISRDLLLGMIALFVLVFLKAFLTQIFLDLKDIRTDKEEGLLTIPVQIGTKKTIKVLKKSTIVVLLILPVTFSLIFDILPLTVLVLVATIPFCFYCFNRAMEKNYIGYILAGSEFILWAVLIKLVQIIL